MVCGKLVQWADIGVLLFADCFSVAPSGTTITKAKLMAAIAGTRMTLTAADYVAAGDRMVSQQNSGSLSDQG